MSKALIIKLILYYASLNGIDGPTALAVAQVESNFNQSVIGDAGEIGIYQILSNYSNLTKKELKDPTNNIKEGLRLLRIAKNTCPHKKNNTWVICYNLGRTASIKIKHPESFIYVKKVNIAMKDFK